MTSEQKQFMEKLETLAVAKKLVGGLDAESLSSKASGLFATKELEKGKDATAKLNAGGVPEKVKALLKELSA